MAQDAALSVARGSIEHQNQRLSRTVQTDLSSNDRDETLQDLTLHPPGCILHPNKWPSQRCKEGFFGSRQSCVMWDEKLREMLLQGGLVGDSRQEC